MAGHKKEESPWDLIFEVVGVVFETAQAISDISSGKSQKVKVSGHYRDNGRGGQTWVEEHTRDYPWT